MILQAPPDSSSAAPSLLASGDWFVLVIIGYAVVYLARFLRPLLEYAAAGSFRADVDRLARLVREDAEQQAAPTPAEELLARLGGQLDEVQQQLAEKRLHAEVALGEADLDELARIKHGEIPGLEKRAAELQEQLREARLTIRHSTTDRLESLQSLRASYSHPLVQQGVQQIAAQFPQSQYQRFDLALLPSFGEYAEKLSAARSMAGVFVLLGLLGTMIKLNGVVDRISEFTRSQEMESSAFLAQMGRLMQEIGGAFMNSIWGVVLMVAMLLVISHINAGVQHRLSKLETVMSQTVVPALAEIHNRHLPEFTLADILRTTGDQLGALNKTVVGLTTGMDQALSGLGKRIGEMLQQFGSYQKQYKLLNDWVATLDGASVEMKKMATELNHAAARVGQPIDQMNAVLQEHLKAQAQFQSTGYIEHLLTEVKAALETSRQEQEANSSRVLQVSDEALGRAVAAAERQTAAAEAQRKAVEQELKEVSAALRATSGEQLGRLLVGVQTTNQEIATRMDRSAAAFEASSRALGAYSQTPTFFSWLTGTAFPTLFRLLRLSRRTPPRALRRPAHGAVQTPWVAAPSPSGSPRTRAERTAVASTPERGVDSTSRPRLDSSSGGKAAVLDLSAVVAAPAERERSPNGRDITAEVESSFVGWCHTAGGNVSRIQEFSETLRSRVNGAEVKVVTRDRDSNVITFVSDGAGDPVEYWMVTAGGRSMLLPRPLNQERFKELHPVYTGSATPHSLRSIEPALVRQEGASWALQSAGRVD
jgi:hypothetical protein